MQIEEIKKAIGENAPDDYILNLQQHQERYQAAFPELVALLQHSEIKHIVSQYQQADQAALQYQKKHRILNKRLRNVIFLGIIFSTLIITAGTLPNHPLFAKKWVEFPKHLLRFSTIATIIFSALGTVYMQLSKGQGYLEKWMKNRALAESERIVFFEKLVEHTPQKNTELQLIVLEYFRRYQLDKQIAYYEYRSRQHDLQYSKITFLVALLAGGVIIVDGITGVVGIKYSFLASLALIFQGYSALMSNQEANEQYQRNSTRYENLARQLAKIRSRIDTIQKAIQEGEATLLASYVGAVHSPMAAEHQEWQDNMSETNQALQDLEQQLSSFGSNKPKQPTAPEKIADKDTPRST